MSLSNTIRGGVFTLLLPVALHIGIPLLLAGGNPLQAGFWSIGWIPVVGGAALYFACFARFLAVDATPALPFTRPVRFLIGEGPGRIIGEGVYRYSRNPMYVSYLLVTFGIALLYASPLAAIYGVCAAVVYHGIVVLMEEPALRVKLGPPYEEYCRRVPRWFGSPS